MPFTADVARLPLMLTELRLPTVKRLWPDLAAQSNQEGWPAERLLATLEWVHWFNHKRLMGPIGYMPPAEAEAKYLADLAIGHASKEETTLTA